MEKPTREIISELIHNRANLVELFLITILLALAVDLVAATLPIVFPLPPVWVLVTGLVIGFVVAIYSILRLFGSTHKSQTFEGFFLYRRKTNQIIPIPRYDFGSHIADYFRAAFVENKAFKTLWDKFPLMAPSGPDVNEKHEQQPRHPSRFIVEATEYFVINELSLHLSAYFQNSQYAKKTLTTIMRNDIPDVLLSNHFLELFSKPMEERPHFVEDLDEDSGNIVYAYGKGGAIFDRFELILPTHSRVRRLSENSLRSIQTDFD